MCIIHTISGLCITFYHGSWTSFKLQGVDCAHNLIQSTSIRRLSKATEKIIKTILHKSVEKVLGTLLWTFSYLLSSSYLYLKATVFGHPNLIMNRRKRAIYIGSLLETEVPEVFSHLYMLVRWWLLVILAVLLQLS